jgi:hypothetical protein
VAWREEAKTEVVEQQNNDGQKIRRIGITTSQL